MKKKRQQQQLEQQQQQQHVDRGGRRSSTTCAAARRLEAARLHDSPKDRRRSFALIVEQIPSFRQLNRDDLFDHNDATTTERKNSITSKPPATQPANKNNKNDSSTRSRRSINSLNSSSNNNNESHHPHRRSRRDSIQKKQLERFLYEQHCTALSQEIEIPETKVTTRKVCQGEDALFRADLLSSPTCEKTIFTESTQSSHTRSTLDSILQDPFFNTSQPGAALLNMDLFQDSSNNDEDLFANIDDSVFSNNVQDFFANNVQDGFANTTADSAEGETSKSRKLKKKASTSKKYGKLGTDIRSVAASTLAECNAMLSPDRRSYVKATDAKDDLSEEFHSVASTISDPMQLTPLSLRNRKQQRSSRHRRSSLMRSPSSSGRRQRLSRSFPTQECSEDFNTKTAIPALPVFQSGPSSKDLGDGNNSKNRVSSRHRRSSQGLKDVPVSTTKHNETAPAIWSLKDLVVVPRSRTNRANNKDELNQLSQEFFFGSQ